MQAHEFNEKMQTRSKQEVKNIKITMKMHARKLSSKMLQNEGNEVLLSQQEKIKAIAQCLRKCEVTPIQHSFRMFTEHLDMHRSSTSQTNTG